jgi:acetyl-CoA synthetase
MENMVEALLRENRVYAPSEEFKKKALIQNRDLYEEAERNPEAFWAKQAEQLEWIEPWKRVLEWTPPYAKWFDGGKINLTYNCLDRHVQSSLRHKAAIVWEGESGESRTMTYLQLLQEVCAFANVLKSLGVKKGDCVAIYMPLVPEAIVAMHACARIGAVHTVVFAGFSSEALKERMLDAEAKVLVTADGGLRRGAALPLKAMADQAVAECPSVKHVVVLKRLGQQVKMERGRDYWYHDLLSQVSRECPPEPVDSEHPLFILYTSGTTGKPKGILHTTAGYLLGVHSSTKWVFDLKPEDLFWCTADVGWVTGHSYVAYGPLSNGATIFLYEGAPDWPEKDRFWSLIEKHRISILYTAPTAIRAFMRWGKELPQKHDLSSLRLLGTVGEPINPEAWVWYYEVIGNSRCPVVDTWWQTETGSIMIAPLPGVTPLKPGSATQPLPGIEARILDTEGNERPAGLLALTKPWPAMMRGIYKDEQRYIETYWSRWGGRYYFTGDGAKCDQDGYFWLMGRVDDVMNVSGHRLGTMEVESALVDHKSVAEAAVIGVTDEVKGQAIVAFVTVKEGCSVTEDELKEHVVEVIGALARPKKVLFAKDLPKTRSGKIMRRLLRDIAEGRVLGDVTTLADPAVIKELKSHYDED